MHAFLTMTSIEPRAVGEALDSGATALILGSWTPDRDALAVLVEAARARTPRVALLARFGRVDGPSLERELAGLADWTPDAIVLPVTHGRDVAHLGARLAVHEAEAGLPDGAIRIVALIASAAAALAASSLVGASPRLAAIGWDADALSQELGISSGSGGEWVGPLAQVRASTRLAAAAAGVLAVETACPAEGDRGFERRLAAARRDGFGAIVTTGFRQTISD